MYLLTCVKPNTVIILNVTSKPAKSNQQPSPTPPRAYMHQTPEHDPLQTIVGRNRCPLKQAGSYVVDASMLPHTKTCVALLNSNQTEIGLTKGSLRAVSLPPPFTPQSRSYGPATPDGEVRVLLPTPHQVLPRKQNKTKQSLKQKRRGQNSVYLVGLYTCPARNSTCRTMRYYDSGYPKNQKKQQQQQQ